MRCSDCNIQHIWNLRHPQHLSDLGTLSENKAERFDWSVVARSRLQPIKHYIIQPSETHLTLCFVLLKFIRLKPRRSTETLSSAVTLETFSSPLWWVCYAVRGSSLDDKWWPLMFDSCSRFVNFCLEFGLQMIESLPCGSFRGRSSSPGRCRTWPSGFHHARLCCRRTQSGWRLSRDKERCWCWSFLYKHWCQNSEKLCDKVPSVLQCKPFFWLI